MRVGIAGEERGITYYHLQGSKVLERPYTDVNSLTVLVLPSVGEVPGIALRRSKCT